MGDQWEKGKSFLIGPQIEFPYKEGGGGGGRGEEVEESSPDFLSSQLKVEG